MSNQLPSRLYHYTSLEVLALILITKTIRFSRLSDLNDPLEGKNTDFKNAERFVYSSSWTTKASDTIPMWKLYTNMSGVRISLPSEMFDTEEPIKRLNFNPRFGSVNVSQLNKSIRAKTGTYSIELRQLIGPEPIDYVSRARMMTENEKITGESDTLRGNMPWVCLQNVGGQKSLDWEFEEEWRFRLPWSINVGVYDETLEEFSKRMQLKYPTVNVALKENIMDHLEVLVGPKTSRGGLILLQALLNTYASKATFKRSEIIVR